MMGIRRLPLALLLAFVLAAAAQLSSFPSVRQFHQWKRRSAGTAQAPPCAIALPRAPLSDPLPAGLQAALAEATGRIIPAAVAAYGLPGVGVSAVYADRTLFALGHGVANTSSRRPADADTLYRMGSITKVFTTLMLHVQRDRGLVRSLDEPITELEPLFQVRNPYGRPITPRQLVMHFSGLPRSSPCVAGYQPCNLTSAEIYVRLATEALKLCPDSMPSYSNLGFAVIGQALARAANTTWDRLLRELVTGPLNMTDTGSHFTPDQTPRAAVGYSVDGSGLPLDMDLGWDSPGGQLFSSPNDMTRLMAFYLADDRSPRDTPLPARRGGAALVGPGTVGELFASGSPFDGGVAIGRPWEMFFHNGYWWRTKSGGVPGFNSLMLLVPEVGFGVNVFVNSDIPVAFDLAANITAAVLPALIAALRAEQPPPPAPTDPRLFVGTYHLEVGPLLSVNFTVSQPQAGGLLRVDSPFASGWLVPPAGPGAADAAEFRMLDAVPYEDSSCIDWASGHNREEVVFYPTDPAAPKQYLILTALAYDTPIRRV